MNDAARTTAFQARVYTALLTVPSGRVTTYRILGDHLGCTCYQAIGQALRRNPFAPRVPCHRVIASDLTIGGFAGNRSGPDIRRKRRLLAEEGVTFVDGKLANPECVLHLPRAPAARPE